MRTRAIPILILVASASLTAGCGAARPPHAAPSAPTLPPVRSTPTAPAHHGETPDWDHSRPATRRDLALARAFGRFARHPNASTLAALGIGASGVRVGLANHLLRTLAASEAVDPVRWQLDPEGYFRGATGPFSALRTLQREKQRLRYTVGRAAHCAGPPTPAPRGLAGTHRISIQPAHPADCLDWFVVDLYADPDQRLVAVTLDLWEP